MMIPYVFGDFSYFLLTLAILAVFVLSLLAQSRVQKVFLQYNRQPAQCGMTAETVAKSLNLSVESVKDCLEAFSELGETTEFLTETKLVLENGEEKIYGFSALT